MGRHATALAVGSDLAGLRADGVIPRAETLGLAAARGGLRRGGMRRHLGLGQNLLAGCARGSSGRAGPGDDLERVGVFARPSPKSGCRR